MWRLALYAYKSFVLSYTLQSSTNVVVFLRIPTTGLVPLDSSETLVTIYLKTKRGTCKLPLSILDSCSQHQHPRCCSTLVEQSKSDRLPGLCECTARPECLLAARSQRLKRVPTAQASQIRLFFIIISTPWGDVYASGLQLGQNQPPKVTCFSPPFTCLSISSEQTPSRLAPDTSPPSRYSTESMYRYCTALPTALVLV